MSSSLNTTQFCRKGAELLFDELLTEFMSPEQVAGLGTDFQIHTNVEFVGTTIELVFDLQLGTSTVRHRVAMPFISPTPDGMPPLSRMTLSRMQVRKIWILFGFELMFWSEAYRQNVLRLFTADKAYWTREIGLPMIESDEIPSSQDEVASESDEVASDEIASYSIEEIVRRLELLLTGRAFGLLPLMTLPNWSPQHIALQLYELELSIASTMRFSRIGPHCLGLIARRYVSIVDGFSRGSTPPDVDFLRCFPELMKCIADPRTIAQVADPPQGISDAITWRQAPCFIYAPREVAWGWLKRAPSLIALLTADESAEVSDLICDNWQPIAVACGIA